MGQNMIQNGTKDSLKHPKTTKLVWKARLSQNEFPHSFLEVFSIPETCQSQFSSSTTHFLTKSSPEGGYPTQRWILRKKCATSAFFVNEYFFLAKGTGMLPDIIIKEQNYHPQPKRESGAGQIGQNMTQNWSKNSPKKAPPSKKKKISTRSLPSVWKFRSTQYVIPYSFWMVFTI
jgi:hypothetical protein